MIANHYGKSVSLPKLRELSETTREGASLKNISDAAEKIGFKTLGVKISLEKLKEEAPLPCIVHWKQNHFVVVYKIKSRNKKSISSPEALEGRKSRTKIFVADPGHGLLEYTEKEFI